MDMRMGGMSGRGNFFDVAGTVGWIRRTQF